MTNNETIQKMNDDLFDELVASAMHFLNHCIGQTKSARLNVCAYRSSKDCMTVELKAGSTGEQTFGLIRMKRVRLSGCFVIVQDEQNEVMQVIHTEDIKDDVLPSLEELERVIEAIAHRIYLEFPIR